MTDDLFTAIGAHLEQHAGDGACEAPNLGDRIAHQRLQQSSLRDARDRECFRV